MENAVVNVSGKENGFIALDMSQTGRQARETETAKANYDQKRNTRTRNSPVKKQQTYRLKEFHADVSLFLFRFT